MSKSFVEGSGRRNPERDRRGGWLIPADKEDLLGRRDARLYNPDWGDTVPMREIRRRRREISIRGGATRILMRPPAAIRLAIGDRSINLTQALKLAGVLGSGGEAKAFIADGLIRVNGAVELRKRRKMAVGDRVAIEGGPTVELTT